MSISDDEVKGYLFMLYDNRADKEFINDAFTGQDNNHLDAYRNLAKLKEENAKDNGLNNDAEFYKKIIDLINNEQRPKPRNPSPIRPPPLPARRRPSVGRRSHSHRSRSRRSRSRSPVRHRSTRNSGSPVRRRSHRHGSSSGGKSNKKTHKRRK